MSDPTTPEPVQQVFDPATAELIRKLLSASQQAGASKEAVHEVIAGRIMDTRKRVIAACSMLRVAPDPASAFAMIMLGLEIFATYGVKPAEVEEMLKGMYPEICGKITGLRAEIERKLAAHDAAQAAAAPAGPAAPDGEAPP